MLKALDLFCCGGGASMGLARAGLDVTGVDIEPRPSYPFRFIQADALTFDLRGFDLIWASPPCQRYTTAQHVSKAKRQEGRLDLIPATRERLQASGTPYIIENVAGAPLARSRVMLCGSMFDLRVIRHRYFECSFPVVAPPHAHKGSLVTGEYLTVTGHCGIPAWTMREREKRGLPRHIPGEMKPETRAAAMGIDWLGTAELSQAIPPAYSEFLARTWLAGRRA